MSNALGRRRLVDKDDMIRNVRSCLRRTQRQPDIVINYFQKENVANAT